MARPGIEQVDPRADPDRQPPVARRVHLGDHGDARAIVHREMVRLHRLRGEGPHERRRLRHEPPDRPVEMGETEQLEGQFVSIACVAGDIATPNQTLQHAVLLIRRSAERLGDLRLAESLLLAGKQFEDIETFVERRRAVPVEFVGIAHLIAPQIDGAGTIVDSVESI